MAKEKLVTTAYGTREFVPAEPDAEMMRFIVMGAMIEEMKRKGASNDAVIEYERAYLPGP